jgi:hypothetical protein
MITTFHWFTAPEAAKCLGVRPLALASVPGFKAVRTTRAPRKAGQHGASRKLYRRTDVEKLRKEQALPKSSRKSHAAKKGKVKPTPNQKKVKAANEALGKPAEPTNTPKLVRDFIDMLKKRDPSITTVRVEISRVDTEIVA